MLKDYQSKQPENKWWTILLSYPDWKQLDTYFLKFMEPYKDEDANDLTLNTSYLIRYFPPKDSIFKCFEICPFDKTKIILVGQDPYIHEGEAMGMCFSVPNTCHPVPPSLKNIFKEMESDIDIKRTETNLMDWAEQGILLLNASLTVLSGKSNSHKKIWLPFIQWFYHIALSEILWPENKPLLLILWGKDAQYWKTIIQNPIDESKKRNIQWIESVHPSPLSAYRGFFGSKPFSKIQNWLTINYPTCDFKF